MSRRSSAPLRCAYGQRVSSGRLGPPVNDAAAPPHPGPWEAPPLSPLAAHSLTRGRDMRSGPIPGGHDDHLNCSATTAGQLGGMSAHSALSRGHRFRPRRRVYGSRSSGAGLELAVQRRCALRRHRRTAPRRPRGSSPPTAACRPASSRLSTASEPDRRTARQGIDSGESTDVAAVCHHAAAVSDNSP